MRAPHIHRPKKICTRPGMRPGWPWCPPMSCSMSSQPQRLAVLFLKAKCSMLGASVGHSPTKLRWALPLRHSRSRVVVVPLAGLFHHVHRPAAAAGLHRWHLRRLLQMGPLRLLQARLQARQALDDVLEPACCPRSVRLRAGAEVVCRQLLVAHGAANPTPWLVNDAATLMHWVLLWLLVGKQLRLVAALLLHPGRPILRMLQLYPPVGGRV
mmetsp:Transcript_7342/g.20889  ORF Transcript_7342/g.20889 Transcript_7342/m.20889 type:complete len:212 (+) Transcript_7342:494-1129(+)